MQPPSGSHLDLNLHPILPVSETGCPRQLRRGNRILASAPDKLISSTMFTSTEYRSGCAGDCRRGSTPPHPHSVIRPRASEHRDGGAGGGGAVEMGRWADGQMGISRSPSKTLGEVKGPVGDGIVGQSRMTSWSTRSSSMHGGEAEGMAPKGGRGE